MTNVGMISSQNQRRLTCTLSPRRLCSLATFCIVQINKKTLSLSPRRDKTYQPLPPRPPPPANQSTRIGAHFAARQKVCHRLRRSERAVNPTGTNEVTMTMTMMMGVERLRVGASKRARFYQSRQTRWTECALTVTAPDSVRGRRHPLPLPSFRDLDSVWRRGGGRPRPALHSPCYIHSMMTMTTMMMMMTMTMKRDPFG
jgi:hypothetical protein